MNIPELFGIDVFNDKEMKKRLSKEIYESLYNTIEQHKELDIKIANEGCCRNEGVGYRARSDTLYSLVSAADGAYRRKA